MNGDVFIGMWLGSEFPAESLMGGGFPGNLLIPRPGAERAPGVGASLEEQGRCGGILKVVVFPLLTKNKFTVSSSWETQDGAGGAPRRWGQLEQGRGLGCTILAGGCGDGVR